MKITKIMAASRRDDIIKQRDDYDAETKRFQDVVDEGEGRWQRTVKDQKSDLEKKLSDMIGPTSLELVIRADPWGSFTDEGWSINIKANERKMFDKDIALAWSWEARIDNHGEVVKDSSSWSGLKAITPEQVADLEESVRVIKLLNNMDWMTILNSPKASRDEFVDKEISRTAWDRQRNRPKFEDDLEVATIEEAIANGDTAFELEQDNFYRGHVGIIPTGLTDKFIKGYIFPISYVDSKTKEELIENWGSEPRRSARTNLVRKGKELVSYKLL